MNKKFSTLAVSTLLASAFSVATYATGETPYRTQNVRSAELNKADSELSTVTKIEEGKYYQLEVGDPTDANDSVLVQTRDYATGRLYMEVKKVTEAPLTASLWKVEVINKTTGNFEYRFVNRETGYYLTYNCATAKVLDAEADVLDAAYLPGIATDTIKSDMSTWRWYVDDEDPAGFGAAKLWAYTHGTRENVFGLVQNDNQEVAMVQIPYAKLTGNNMANFKIMELTLRKAGVLALTADEINQMIDADGSWTNRVDRAVRDSAKFKGFTGISELIGVGYKAIETAQTGLTADYDAYTVLLKKGNKYLKVAEDATYEPDELPTAHGGLKVGLEDPTVTLGTAVAINATDARYHWRVTYYPTPDSLVFEPLNASIVGKVDYQNGTKWNQTGLQNAAIGLYYNTVNAGVEHAAGVASATTNVPFTGKAANEPVALMAMNGGDDYDNQAVITVGNPKRAGTADATYVTSRGKHVTVYYDEIADMGLKISFDNAYTPLTRSTIANGLYFINLHTAKPTMVRQNGAYLVDNMEGHLMYDNPAMDQKFEIMPATQWVVEQDPCGVGFDQTPTVQIRNREYGNLNNTVFKGQLYYVGDKTIGANTVKLYTIIDHQDYTNGYDSYGKFTGEWLSCGDTIYFTEVTDPIAMTATHGYKYFSQDILNDAVENNYQLKYNHFENENLYLQSALGQLSVVSEDNNPTYYEIAEATLPTNAGALGDQAFGYAGNVAGIQPLVRKAYVIKVKDRNLIDNNRTYIALAKGTDNKFYYKAVKKGDIDGVDVKWAYFYLKADQLHAGQDTCYVLVDVNDPNVNAPQLVNNVFSELQNGWNKANVVDGLGYLRYSNLNDNPEDRSSAFYLQKNTVPQYIDLAKEYGMNLNDTVKIWRKAGASVEYLFEDACDRSGVQNTTGQEISKTLGYLGVENKGVTVQAPALYVDEVRVARGTNMPQYLLGVAVDSVADGYVCVTDIHGYWENEADAIAQEGEGTPAHYTEYIGYTAGRFLINLTDSITPNSSSDKLENADKYKFDSYTRLAFVQAVHQVGKDGKEYLYIVKPGHSLAELMTIKDNTNEQATYVKPGYVLDPAKLAELTVAHELTGAHNNYVFALRKLNNNYDGVSAETSEPFLLESNGEGSKPGSFEGAWVKIHNGVPVLAQITATGDHEDADTSIGEIINQAQIFNFGVTDEIPTDNEEITTSSVKVFAKDGAVEISGAAGKTVAICNMLGQVVATTVVSSDNATVAAPAGFVIVKIEGEKAVKANVK